MQNQIKNPNQNLDSEQNNNQEQPLKKEPLSFVSVKILLAILLFIELIVVIIGGWVYAISVFKTDLPISNPVVNPVIEAQCEIDNHCKLIPVGGCPCNTLDEEFKCFPREEAIEKQRQMFNSPERLLCTKCPQPLKIQHTCECNNGKCEKVKIEAVEEVSITTDKMEYEMGEDVGVVIENNFSEKIFISEPIVEKRVDSNYVSLRGSIVYWFECGITDGLIYIPFIPSKVVKYEWDQKEKWCSADFSDRNVYLEEVLPGKYRIKSEIIKRVKSEKDDPNNISGELSGDFIYSNEFTIKEKSALDARCGEKVTGDNGCGAQWFGYEFDQNKKTCNIKVVVGCSYKTPFETLEECQEVCEEKECAKEGEFINYPSGTNKNLPDACCEGLKELAGFGVNENGECERLKGGPHLTCMPCGNGICEEINNFKENKCNCPEDCK